MCSEAWPGMPTSAKFLMPLLVLTHLHVALAAQLRERQPLLQALAQRAEHRGASRGDKASAVPSSLHDEVNGARELRSKAAKASLCRWQELTKQDSYFAPNSSRKMNTKVIWTTLFRKWADKRILLAGDSMMEQFFQVVACAAELMGAQTYFANVMKFQWEDGTTAFANDTSDIPWGEVTGGSSENRNTQAVVYRLLIRKLPINREDTVSVTWVDYFRYYALTEQCQKCGPGCGACAQDRSFVTKVDTLVRWVGKYDKAYINMGHDMGGLDGSIMEQKAELLTSRLESWQFGGRTVFVEHPAQHFPGSSTGDWLHSLSHTECKCDLPRIEEQTVAKNNRILTNICKGRRLAIARIWGPFAKYGCDKQRPPDCTHYHISPTFWGPAVQIISAAG